MAGVRRIGLNIVSHATGTVRNIVVRLLALLTLALVASSCSPRTDDFHVLELRGHVEVIGHKIAGGPPDGYFTLLLAEDGRFHEAVKLQDADRVNEMLYDGSRLILRSFLTYPEASDTHAGNSERELWQNVMDALRTSTESKRITLDSTTTSLEVILEQIDVSSEHPVPKVWRRTLGGPRSIPYRSRGTGIEAKQVLLFQVNEVRRTATFELDRSWLTSR